MPDSQDSLRMTAARGVFWIGGGQIIRQILGTVTAVVLARLLTPQDFGLLAMAYVFIQLAELFADFGIGAAIIQSKDVHDSVLSSAFWANVVVAAVLMLIMIVASPFIARYYADSRVGLILVALSLTLLLSGANVVPRATLYKHLKFDRAIKAQVLGSLVGAGASIVLAVSGVGVWSLVAQPICGSVVTLSLTFAYCPWRPRWEFDWNRIDKLTKFSAHVLSADLLIYAGRNGDKLLIGKFLGSTSLGYYNLAYQLMLYPLSQVASVIVKVLFPTLSVLQDEAVRFRQAYLKAVSAIALITFPAMIGLFVVSRDFVLAVFGAKWLPMLPVLQILCWVGMVQSISATQGTIFLSTANTRTMLKLALVSAPLILFAFVIGLKWDIVGVATCYAIVIFLLTYLQLALAFKIAQISFREFHTALARPLGASIVMAAVVWFAQQQLQGLVFSPVARLLISVVTGAVTYTGISLVINKNQLRELFVMSKALMERRGGS